FLQSRFVIEQFDLGRTAGLRQEDDTLGFRRVMRESDPSGIAFRGVGPLDESQRNRAQTDACASSQKVPAADRSEKILFVHRFHPPQPASVVRRRRALVSYN